MVVQPALEPLRRWDPERIGPYVLLGRLGAGAMGQVFLGRSTAGRLVAVKTIKIEFAEEAGFRARFAHEVAAARRVSGVFTAAVVAADADADVPWLATAYVPAPSLTELVRTCGPLPVAGHPVAGRRVCRGAGVDPHRRAGAPRSQAVQRARLTGRAPGDRLRGGQGRRADPAHGDPRRRGHARLHGTGAGTRHPPGVGRQRHVLARRDPAVRGDRARPVPGRDRDGRAGPARHRAAGPGRAARGTDRPGHLLPGTQPPEAAHLRCACSASSGRSSPGPRRRTGTTPT